MKKVFNTRLPIELLDRLQKFSKESGLKIWRIVTDALEIYLRKNK